MDLLLLALAWFFLRLEIYPSTGVPELDHLVETPYDLIHTLIASALGLQSRGLGTKSNGPKGSIPYMTLKGDIPIVLLNALL